LPVSPRFITDDEWLVRGIPANGINAETGRPNSFYFKSAELSTSLLTIASVRHLLELHTHLDEAVPFVQLAAVNVGVCRNEFSLTVTHTPIENEAGVPDNPEHVSIYMPKSGRGRRGARLRDHALIVEVSDSEPTMLFDALTALTREREG
jgi:hypothetical protein